MKIFFIVPFLWLNFLLLIPGFLNARPLEQDPRIVTGKLSNGVTWIYRKHAVPPGKMAFILHVRTGSLNETDDQRGLAHFLEHMCFNGSTHFPPGKLVPYFESLGMQFGADLNAFTSFDQTSYLLFTPDTSTEQMDRALMVLSDYAFGASLFKKEIDKERGIILEEARTGKSAEQRIRDKLWPELFEGSRFALRLPIGDEAIVAKAPRSEFESYYRDWYRPENVTVLIVGDREPEGVGQLVEKWFGKAGGQGKASKPKGPEFKVFSKDRALVVADPEMSLCEIQMIKLQPGRPPAVTSEQWRTELLESIGTWMLNRRYDELVKKGSVAYREAEASVDDFFNDALLVEVGAKGEPKDWAKIVQELAREVKRASDHGFTQHELDLAKQDFLNRAKHAAQSEPTQNARGLLMSMLAAVNERRPFLSAEQRLNLAQELLSGIRLEELNKLFQKYLEPGAFAYVVILPEKKGLALPSQTEVMQIVQSAWKQPVEAIHDDQAPAQILSSLPKAGKETEISEDRELGIRNAWFENGVRVHYRQMDYKKDTVLVSISLAGGEIEETPQNAGITGVSAIAINTAATHRISSTAMRDLLIGKQVAVQGSVEGDTLTIRVTGSPSDLETGLQEVHALLTDGKIEEAAFKNWKLKMLQEIESWKTMPEVQADMALEDLLSGGDPRRTAVTKEKVNSQSLESAQRWFDRLSREAPLEVAIVGDIPEKKAMALAAQYFGSLPSRKRSADYLDPLRNCRRANGPLTRRVEVPTITPQGMVLMGFMGSEGKNARDARALQMASQILNSRLIKRVREELSIVYSIHTVSIPSWIYRDDGRWIVAAPCGPSNVTQVTDEVSKILTDFAEKGPTDDELKAVKKQFANLLDIGMREPEYWLNLLKQCDFHGRDLEQEKIKKQEYQRMTASEIQQVFRKYYHPERLFQIAAAAQEMPSLVNGKKESKEQTGILRE